MSISRPKRPTFRKPDAAVGSRPQGQTVKLPKWKDVIEGKPDDAFAPYAPAAAFAMEALVSHVKFGKGVVVGLEPGKVSILFEAGVKKLVCTS
jgi:hypothetical protein